MTSVTSKTTVCVYAFCAAEMAGKLIRNVSEKLPVEGACPVFGKDLQGVQLALDMSCSVIAEREQTEELLGQGG